MRYRTGDVVEVTDGMSKDYALIKGKSEQAIFDLYCDKFTYSSLPEERIVKKVSGSEMRGCSGQFRALVKMLEIGRDIEEASRRMRR